MPDIVLVEILTSTISAVIGALVGAIVSKVKTVRERGERERRDADDLKLMMMQNTMMTCRLAIYSDKFSVDEKLEAYAIYSGHGWNHQTKTYMDGLVGGDADEYVERHKIGGIS